MTEKTSDASTVFFNPEIAAARERFDRIIREIIGEAHRVRTVYGLPTNEAIAVCACGATFYRNTQDDTDAEIAHKQQAYTDMRDALWVQMSGVGAKV